MEIEASRHVSAIVKSAADTVDNVSPSIFTRRGSAESDSVQAESVDAPAVGADSAESGSVPSFRDVAAGWRVRLSEEIQREAGSHPVTRLVLSQAHPGGLAQLYAEHPTRLENLVRDPSSLQITKAAAFDVIRQAEHMQAEHGSVVIHLAIGTASWEEASEEGEAPTNRTTPILLRPIDLEIDDAGEITLALRPGIEISNRLLAELARYGAVIEPAAIVELVRTRHGFSPAPALQKIREVGAMVPTLELRDSLTIGIYSHPTSTLLRELGAPQWLSLSPVVRALAGEKQALDSLDRTFAEPNPNDRDPWKERGVGEASPAVADIVETATGDDSVYIEVSSPTDLTRMAASIAAEHAAQGKKVLVVTGRSGLQQPVVQFLESEGAFGIANVVGASASDAEAVRISLREALDDASDLFNSEQVDEMRTRLRRSRETLSSYTMALHEKFPQWGVSAFDALQVLTDLTSIPGGPKTKVRLTPEALVSLANDQGEAGRELLEKAAEVGVFDGNQRRNWWSGIQITDPARIESALETLQLLDQSLLPATRLDMERVAEETGLRISQTPASWQEQLSLLEGVRDSLDVFWPEVFERSAADMVIATATKEWRKAHGINMGRSQRRTLLRQAKDLLLPGRYVEDVHAQLILVQERREEWKRACGTETWPMLPQDIEGILDVNSRLVKALEELRLDLAPVYGDLQSQDIDELAKLVHALASDPDGARELPQRVGILRQLDELGLSSLVKDLQDRLVAEDMLGLELHLAWWASVLGLMLASDHRLGGFDPSSLQEILAEVRALEEAQVRSLGPQARSRILRLRQSALAANPEAYSQAVQALESRMPAAAYYSRIPLAWDLQPIVVTAPTLVPQVVPWGRHVDVVVLVGVDHLPLAELVPVIARGSQVTVLGASQTDQPDRAGASLASVLPTLTMHGAPQRLNDSVVRLLARHGLEAAGISVPGRRSVGRVDLLAVDGRAMPAPGIHAIESSAAEVEAVAALVRQHMAERPETSLAVVALNRRHGDRIRRMLDQEVDVDTVEPFAVVDAEDIGALRRDRIIVSVGFAKTPHGRVIHDFGPYSQPQGEQLLAEVLRSVRQDLTIVTSIASDEIDEDRLRHEGSKLLADLIRLGESAGNPTDSEAPWPTLEAEPDHLLVDLAERLYRLGLNVVPNLGVSGGIRIPLGIGHPEVPGELLVAILTDDDDYLDEPSLRVRDWLRPRLLEDQGWKVRTELSMAVFIDPNREAEAIVQLVLDAVDEFYESNPELRPAIEVEAAEETPEDPESIDPTHQVDLPERITDPEEDFTGAAAHVPAAPAIPMPSSPRPPIAVGLPLAAYGDDQLDEVAIWILNENPNATIDEAAQAMREALQVTRRGAQSDAVLRNVVKRNWREPALAGAGTETEAGEPTAESEPEGDRNE